MRSKPSTQMAMTAGAGFASQLVNSATNVAIGFIAASTLSTSDFGVFSAVYLGLTSVVGLSKAAIVQPLSIELVRARNNALPGAAIAAMTCLGVVCGIAMLVSSIFGQGQPYAAVVAVLGFGAPAIFLHEALRQALFASERALIAFFIDCVWAVVQVSTMAAIALQGIGTATLYVTSWWSAALVGSIAGLMKSGLRLNFSEIGSLRLASDHGRPFAAEYALQVLPRQVLLLSLGVLVSLSDLAALRGGLLFFGLHTSLALGLQSAFLPIASRLGAENRRHVARATVVIGAALFVTAALTGILLASLPTPLGTLLLGDTFESANRLGFSLGLYRGMTGVVIALILYGRGIGMHRIGIASRGVGAVATLGFGLGAAKTANPASAVSWALTASATLTALAVSAEIVYRRPALPMEKTKRNPRL